MVLRHKSVFYDDMLLLVQLVSVFCARMTKRDNRALKRENATVALFWWSGILCRLLLFAFRPRSSMKIDEFFFITSHSHTEHLTRSLFTISLHIKEKIDT